MPKFLSHIQLPVVLVKAADQAVTATADTDITDLQTTVAIGKYWFRMFANISATGTSPTARWRVTGPAATGIVYWIKYNTGATGAATVQLVAGWAANTGTQAISAATTVGCIIEGYANITAPGVLKCVIAATGTVPSLSVKANSVFVVEKLI